ncbi:uncharacterized protein EI90DRAFT_2987399 [Cantharellus anzutake]|uniref:uncharacterized protein n=1 Tax=Cantharellus anzutake TaxID=1750568 RepID=UPI001902F562|nr:uncharacterized protein EI90DRAFT_3283474 [Cantharellus anzutake]XP_038923975.1 uncharacterized protein EI90DRAFT_2987399 [Cantharellus anzutake]KAF8310224.1 hypothetical protein EI90DRAFT_3283474 [Cantharellus anzutake]KAF8344089.1 hypothetical protein EI90DRAFT_2987399 [Cantharellus anzutake]
MQILNIHTPHSSFSILHSLQQDNVQMLFEKLSRKSIGAARGKHVGPGWVKYQHGGSYWNLDDESDYSIFAWRHKSDALGSEPEVTIHMHDPDTPLPVPPEFQNPHFYTFLPTEPPAPRPYAKSLRSVRSRRSTRSLPDAPYNEPTGVAKFKADFHRFHSENGVRTVRGSIGPVSNVRMLLKSGYRHVYISRNFAKRHGFIPENATPGMYGYTGLISIGEWPITLGSTTTRHQVYLSEETHFDVVLGRSFMEKRSVKVDLLDFTLVHCMDTGEKIDCEVVIIRDGKGEYVTVT